MWVRTWNFLDRSFLGSASVGPGWFATLLRAAHRRVCWVADRRAYLAGRFYWVGARHARRHTALVCRRVIDGNAGRLGRAPVALFHGDGVFYRALHVHSPHTRALAPSV